VREFDAIVVGAGPAGITTAYMLARKGVDTLLLERGEFPGAKNMFGGVVTGESFTSVVDGFWAEGVVERPITRKVFSVLGDNKMLSIDFTGADPDHPYGFTAYRPRLDRWYAGIAQKNGVDLVAETSVEELVTDGKRVVGVKTDRGGAEVCANVVVLADGVNSIAQRQGDRDGRTGSLDCSLGVKEVIRVGPAVFRRLGVPTLREGVSQEFVGLDQSLVGGGFLYTNSDSLSLGVVVTLRSLLDGDRSIAEVFDAFKNVPYIMELIADGQTLEYSAHLIPSARVAANLFSDGLLVTGDAAGFVLNTGLHFEGVNLAIRSGMAAADTVLHCMKKNDYSKRATRNYLVSLERHGVLSDARRYSKAVDLIKSPAFHRHVPGNTCRSLHELLASGRTGRRKKLLHEILSDRNMEDKTAYLKQLYKILRAYVC